MKYFILLSIWAWTIVTATIQAETKNSNLNTLAPVEIIAASDELPMVDIGDTFEFDQLTAKLLPLLKAYESRKDEINDEFLNARRKLVVALDRVVTARKSNGDAVYEWYARNEQLWNTWKDNALIPDNDKERRELEKSIVFNGLRSIPAFYDYLEDEKDGVLLYCDVLLDRIKKEYSKKRADAEKQYFKNQKQFVLAN